MGHFKNGRSSGYPSLTARILFVPLVTYKTPQTCKAPLTPKGSLSLPTGLNSESPEKSLQNSSMNDNSGASANADDGELGSDAEGQTIATCSPIPLPSFAVNNCNVVSDDVFPVCIFLLPKEVIL